MDPEQSSIKLVGFTVIVDDIVFPDGSTSMAQLGGGGPQTIWGFQLATNQEFPAGLCAGVGADLPPECKSWLESINVDTSGLILYPRGTPRAWQRFDKDGRRTQEWRGNGDADDTKDVLYEMLRPKFEVIPPHFQQAKSVHLGVHPSRPPLTLMRKLREAANQQGGCLSIEPFTVADKALTEDELRLLLSSCDIFSPNLLEATSMLEDDAEEGDISAQELARRFLDVMQDQEHAAQLICLRCGADGAYVVPAVHDTEVVDVTGCGNAFCGGFLAHWDGAAYETSNRQHAVDPIAAPVPDRLLTASLWGSVSASLMAEERGVPSTPIHALQKPPSVDEAKNASAVSLLSLPQAVKPSAAWHHTRIPHRLMRQGMPRLCRF
eukprot:gene13212-19047_t